LVCVVCQEEMGKVVGDKFVLRGEVSGFAICLGLRARCEDLDGEDAFSALRMGGKLRRRVMTSA
jgi:hypothetical protein